MITLRETKTKIMANRDNWQVYLMDFVDDFRYYKNLSAISEPFGLSDEKVDAMLASTASTLCVELKIPIPQWIENIPAVSSPWFVSGLENLKAISLVESPLYFRRRKIFVLENFLQRV